MQRYPFSGSHVPTTSARGAVIRSSLVLVLFAAGLLFGTVRRPVIHAAPPEGLAAADWQVIHSMLPPSLDAYLKASNTGAGDQFGLSAAVDGDTVVIGAPGENSAAMSVNGNQFNNSAPFAGAAYVFVRRDGTWTQQAYLKASNTRNGHLFGVSVALDGNTVVIGAYGEDSATTGVNGNQADTSAFYAGAAYVFTRNGATWTQQAYLKASNTNAFDSFGGSVAIFGDTIVVGADGEKSAATGVGGDQADNSAVEAGAAYVFVRTGTAWSQQAYLKASNTEANDRFGGKVALDGTTIVIGAPKEDSGDTGVDGHQGNNRAVDAGAAYVFTRSGGTWSQQAYLKATNTEALDEFGTSVAVAGDTVVVGAPYEDSAATGMGGDQDDNSAFDAGAAYVFTRSGATWSPQAYLKASNTEANDAFGWSVTVSGATVVIGAPSEDSAATGVGGDQANNSAPESGAAYVFTRRSGTWTQQLYRKAATTEAGDYFGASVAISGATVVVGAYGEDSAATGVGGNPANNSAEGSGAVSIVALPPTRLYLPRLLRSLAQDHGGSLRGRAGRCERSYTRAQPSGSQE